MKKSYTLCEGTDCPIKESCARHLPDLDRKTTDYFDPIPYDVDKKRCGFFELDEPENLLNQLNILSNYEEHRNNNSLK